ncbi:aminotransferase class V-fold PLP-dependent enzyme [Mongoliibacter ruber]|uniref:Selenocysteine lyase/cysteine desulfurase n=1 Tax=Mongoliibacter ruber TaxID=1750599 RepID=A0A2T0WBI3_9BACT|nr:aminotransferase class V-fold PLP-dependent enzyme [Mongoliibacter ruber]PRY84080.1 selenocysteine lyase/cysteine desulfurase [Mongoliibacter ruber]
MSSPYKSLFSLPEDIHYLNCAYMAPQLKSVEQVGIEALQKKNNPTQIKPIHFFEQAAVLREQFGTLVNASAEQCAIIPSASYGLMNAVNNLPLNNGNEALVVGEEFPSGYFSIERWCKANGKNLKVLSRPEELDGVGEKWNQTILDSIDSNTAVVLMSTVHWTDGTKFMLEAIGEKCRQHNAYLILDGTQSVGALPIDVMACYADALVCSGYKWLLGPYSIGMAYYSEKFNQGIPLEESWMNRSNAQEFSSLTNYADAYSPGAGRYNMGEFSNFNLVPMLSESIRHILEWRVDTIENHNRELAAPLFPFLHEKGFAVGEEAYRCAHLFGIQLPNHIKKEKLLANLESNRVFVSVRGEAIRISLHLFNTADDIQALMDVLDQPSK